MALAHSPKIATDGLILCLDAANSKSYPGTGTTWADLSGSGNNGTLVNGVGYDSNDNGVMVFDGVNDTATFPLTLDDLPALSNFSIEAWVSFPSYPTTVSPPNQYGNTEKAGVLVGAANYVGTALYWYGNTTGTGLVILGFVRSDSGFIATNQYSVSLNEWNHFVFINNYSSSVVQFYVNGTLFHQLAGPTQSYSSSLSANAGNIGISRSQVHAGGTVNYSPITCNMSNVKIYQNIALTADQVEQNFNALRGRFGI